MVTQTNPERAAPLQHLTDVAAALTRADQPGPSLAALDSALAQTIGHKLFTVLVLNFAKNENQRYYSNQPKAYPTGGSKPIETESDLYKEVVLGGRPRICRDAQDIRRAFFDHELIASLGCESAVNVPVRWNGTTLGTLNLLHQARWYGEAELPLLSAFAALAVPAMLEIIRRW
ncbi:GAF domain-containing protein [Rhizobiales bacterium GAS191]|jgi:hypothetical protein|nr:GAF domain-containing protein [Rhizobiales bacterium GAS113]SEC63670.1 GAF domain-containing protein [Rhizobiales bacterium GAS188]SEC65392.1 GAF domain-containing protein [Rhizobiales bacterium GAS191]